MKKTKQVMVIDIGSSSVKILILDLSGANIKLLKTKLIELPETAGEKKEGIIKTSLHEFLNQNPSIRNVYVSISSPYVDIERLEFPKIPQEELKEAVRLRLKDKISYDLGEAIIDFIITDEYAKEDGAKEIIVMAAVTKRKDIDPILNILQELQLNITGINAIPFGLANIIEYKKDIPPEETTALVEIGDKYSMVSLYKSNKLVFTRHIPISSSQITDAMCGVLVSDKGRIELTREEAENIKTKYGYPIDQTEILDGKIMPNQVVSMIRPLLEHLANEIKRTFTYFSIELKGAIPKRIYLAGGGGRLKNLDKFLNLTLNINVQLLELPDNIKNDTDEDNQSILSYLGMIGCALPVPGKKINLLPQEIRIQKAESVKKISIRMVGFTVLSILVILYIGINIRIAGIKKQLESLKAYSSVLKKVSNLNDEFIEWNDAVSVIKGGEISIESLFKEISNVLPHNMLLTEFSMDLDKKEVIFRGTLYPKTDTMEDELTKFMEALERSRHFREANLVLLRKDTEGNQILANFEISCVLE